MKYYCKICKRMTTKDILIDSICDDCYFEGNKTRMNDENCILCGKEESISDQCFICQLRQLTAKPPSNSTQREKNIHQSATRLLANLEDKEEHYKKYNPKKPCVCAECSGIPF